MSSTDTDEEHKYTVIHSKSDNIDIVINDKAGEVIEEHFWIIFFRYEIDLEESVKGSDFIFDFEDLSHKKQIS